jgi:Cof subfamily protein (haloacid dehalogenase superfamily)
VRVRLIAIDIDGTLLDSRGRLPDANRRAVHAAVTRGVEVVLVTGRTFHHARPIAAKLGAALTLIVSNGALVKTSEGRTLATRLIPRHLARDLIVATRPVRGGAAIVFDRPDAGQYVYERIDWSHPQRRWYYDRNHVYMTETAPLETALDEEPVQVAFTGGVEEMRTLARHVRDLPCATRLTLTLTEYEDRDFSLFDVTAHGCSKGATLSDWTARREVRPAEVMAVGDNLNDQDMLEFAGHPVVMGNAVPELKRRGWPLTAGHDDNGLAQAIETRVLGTRRRGAGG